VNFALLAALLMLLLLLLLALALAGWLRLLLTASCIHVILIHPTVSLLLLAVITRPVRVAVTLPLHGTQSTGEHFALKL
jgi:hypothetical protein